MSKANIVPYDDEQHRDSFYQMTHDYLSWAHDLVLNGYGMEVFPDGDVTGFLVDVFPVFASISPPHGEILLLDVGGEVVGMCVLKELDDGVGEIKRMYICPEFRGNGYSKVLLKGVEERAVDFGYTILRLDTSRLMEAAIHLYRKSGFIERGVYPGNEWEDRTDAHDLMVFMEKKL